MRQRQLYQGSRKLTYALFTAILSFGLLIPSLWSSVASAGAQLQTRSITLSSSSPGATGVTYSLTFTPQTTEQSLIVDFCSNSPLIGDTCSFATTTVPTTTGVTGNTGTVSSVGAGTPPHTIQATGLTLTAGTPYTITFSGLTNPSTAGGFYARILTYATTGATSYVPAATSGVAPTSGSFVDYGGDALSTANNISITAKVFETLSFCVFQTSCGTAPTLTLGDSVTGALSTANAYVNSNAQYTISTNAGSGVSVTMAGTTLCRVAPLNSTNCPTGTNVNTIKAIGATPATKIIGTQEQFGMCADISGAVGLTVATTYKDTSAANCHGITTGTYAGTALFGFNDAASAGGTNNVAGSQVLSSTGAVATYTGSFAFLADITPTTEAGIYNSNLNLVATSTF